MPQSVEAPIKETAPKDFDLYVVGVDISFTPDGKLNTFEPERETDMQALTLFGWAESTGHNGLPLLAPFPLFEGIGEERSEVVNKFVMENLHSAFAEVNGVEQDVLRFPLLRDVAGLFDARLRHEAGYALMLLSKDRSKGEPPKEFEQAMWNTGNLLLRSAGVDWWIEEDGKQAIEEAYNEYFHEYWGDLPPLFDPERLSKKIFTSEFDMVLTQLHVMKDAKEIKGTLDYEEMAQLGHGFAYVAGHVAEKTQLVFGPRWPSLRSTPVGSSWVGIQVRFPEYQLPLPATFS